MCWGHEWDAPAYKRAGTVSVALSIRRFKVGTLVTGAATALLLVAAVITPPQL